jgi:hypothetical protein
MKRLFIAALVFVALTATVSAQEFSPNYLGIKGGVNYVKIFGDGIVDIKHITTYAIGAFYQYRVNERFAFSPEVYYSVMGAKVGDDGEDIEWNLGYIDIPVLFKLMFPTENTITPCLYGGGYLGFLMSAKVNEHDAKDSFKSTDYGLLIGASLDMGIGGGKQLLNLDVRYIYGLAEIQEEGQINIFNGGFQFLLGWGFSL